MGKILDVDGPVFGFFSRIADIWILNLLWVVSSLPIITIGASTTALIRAMMKAVIGQEGHAASVFFSAFKSNFKKSTIIWLIMAPIGAVLFFALSFWSDVEGTAAFVVASLNIALMIPYFLILLYVFALQGFFENTIKRTFTNAILMANKHFGQTFRLIVIIAVVIILNKTTPLVNFIMLSVGVGIVAYLASGIYRTIFLNYVKIEERPPSDWEPLEQE